MNSTAKGRRRGAKKHPIKINKTLQARLFLACHRCDVAMISTLLTASPFAVDVNGRDLDRDGLTPLLLAVLNDSAPSIEALALSPLLDFNYREFETGNTPLHVAIEHGCVSAVRALLAQRAISPNICNTAGNTPLHTAIIHERPEFVAALLNTSSTNLEAVNNEGLTPLALAALQTQVTVVRMLLRRGANPLTQCTADAFTPLHLACAHGSSAIILDMKRKCDPARYAELLGIQDAHGHTPLHIAVAEQHTEVVKLLLEHGSDPSLLDNNSNDAFQFAIQSNNAAILEVLLVHGSAVSTAHVLHKAAFIGDVDSVMYLSRVKSESVDEQDENGNTPLLLSLLGENFDCAQILLPLCYKSVDVCNHEGDNALHLAIKLKNSPIVKKLFEIGAHINIPDKDGTLPLALAIEHTFKDGFIEIGKEMPRSFDDSYTTPNKRGRTAVHYAAMSSDFVDVLRMEELTGEHLNLQDKDGCTPLYLACENANEAGARVLLEERHGLGRQPSVATLRNLGSNIVDEEGNRGNSRSSSGGNLGSSFCKIDVNLCTTSKRLSPLHACAKTDAHEIAELILATGCCCTTLNHISTDGDTPLDIAYKAKSPGTAHTLFLNGGRGAAMLKHFAAIKIQTMFRTKRGLLAQEEATELSDKSFGMFRFVARCMLATVRTFFMNEAVTLHKRLLSAWVERGLFTPSERIQAFLADKEENDAEEGQLATTPRASESHVKHGSGSSRRDSMASLRGDQGVVTSADHDLSDDSKPQALPAISEAAILQTAPSKMSFAKQGLDGTKNPRIEAQKRVLDKFQKRMETLNASVDEKTAHALPTLPRKEDPDGVGGTNSRHEQKLLRKELKESLYQAIKLRSDANSLLTQISAT